MNIEEEIAKVCASARSYAGVRWRAHGRSRDGVDCIGFGVMSYRGAGWEVDEGTPDYRGLDGKRLVAVLKRHCILLPEKAQVQPADFVIFGVPREGHLGLLVDGAPLNIMHCPAYGKVIETRFEPARGKIRGFYRWRQFYLPSR